MLLKFILRLFILVGIITFFQIDLISKEESDIKINEHVQVKEILNSINPDSVYNIILELENYGSRFALKDNRREIAVSLKNRFIDMGYTNAYLDSFYIDIDRHSINYTQWQYNVIARLDADNDTSKIILGAHYDSINQRNDDFDAPGADDNASGVAAVLETARVLKKYNIKPKHNIVFICFAAEELDRLGSRYYAQYLKDNNTDVKLMINNDMIAYNPASDDTQWKFNIQKYEGSSYYTNIIKNLSKQHTKLNPVFANSFVQYADSYSFHKRGFNTVFLNAHTFNRNLHTRFDRIDYINIDYCTEMIKLSALILLYFNT